MQTVYYYATAQIKEIKNEKISCPESSNSHWQCCSDAPSEGEKRDKIFFLWSGSLFLFLFPSLLSLLYILLKLKPCYSDTFNCENNETVAKRNQYSQGNQDNMEEYNQESAS